jgi:hypothetical protein
MTNASSTTRRPARTTTAQQGTTTTRTTDPSKVTPADAKRLGGTADGIKEATERFGLAKGALSGVVDADAALMTAETNARAWVAIARATTLSERAWAVATQSGKTSLPRLRWVGDLMDASRKGTGTRALSLREAVKVANVATKEQVTQHVADMLAGRDPLGTKGTTAGSGKARDGIAPSKGKGTRSNRSGKVTTVAPDGLADLLRKAIAVAPHIATGDVAVDVAKLATELATIATARAAALHAPASTRTRAKRDAKVA